MPSLLLAGCSQEQARPAAEIPAEKFSSEDEVLFQQEAALHHTLESLKQQQKEEQALQDIR